MKSAQHTPGPWKLLHHTAPQHDGDRAVYGPNNKLICDMNGGPNDNSETLANARLIAAAPDMLGILRRAAIRLEGGTIAEIKFNHSLSNAIREVIAKAEGRI